MYVRMVDQRKLYISVKLVSGFLKEDRCQPHLLSLVSRVLRCGVVADRQADEGRPGGRSRDKEERSGHH